MLKRIEVLLGKARTPVFCFDRNRYFIDALTQHADAEVCFRPFSAQLFSMLRAKNIRGAYNLWSRWTDWFHKTDLPLSSDHIGQYNFVYDQLTVKVVVDTSDGRHLHNTDALEWSDVYFKCNYWPNVDYPQNVVSLVNGNGTLSATKVRKLKNLRNHKKEYDLVYWSRIWAAPGNNQDNKGVEHNIRLFEALAKVEGKTNLLAVFPKEMNNSSLQKYRERLDAVGVKWQNGWGKIDSKVLWTALASARINFLRPGNHLCISWRMMDLLCMGSCIMVDGEPFARWPEPLSSDVNFVDVECSLSPEYELPGDRAYEEMAGRISNLISEHEKIEKISENNIQYFEEHASMNAVANYISQSVRQKYPEIVSAMGTL